MQKLSGMCPQCETELVFKKPPSRGQSVICRYCNMRLEVIQRNPVVLDWLDDDPFVYVAQRDVKRQKREPRRKVSKEVDW